MSDLLSALGHGIRQVKQEICPKSVLRSSPASHRTYIGSVEQDGRNLSIENVHKIASALGVSMTELIQLCEDRLDRSKENAGSR